MPFEAGVFEIGLVEQTLDQLARNRWSAARWQNVPTVLVYESKGRGSPRLSLRG
jgi:hypothetical protein